MKLYTLYQHKIEGWLSKEIDYNIKPSIGESIKIGEGYYKIVNIIHYADEGTLEVVAHAD